MHTRITQRLAAELPGLRATQVEAALALFADNATVPFIARYRKEKTGGLDEVALRRIAEVHHTLVELDKRRAAILETLTSDGLLTPELARQLANCESRATLEDLYLPFKKKRKTRASTARERGLGPLGDLLLDQGQSQPEREARRFIGPEVPDVATALAGARDIAAETLTEHAPLRALVRQTLLTQARLTSRAIAKTTAGVRTAFEDYYDHAERVDRMPSHRFLAMARGEREGFLRLGFDLDEDRVLGELLRRAGHNPRSPWGKELELALSDGFKRLLRPQIETEVMATLRERADRDAVGVFAKNLESLLFTAPLGPRSVIGLDPGFRSGVKVALVDAAGDVSKIETIFPHTGAAARAAASQSLLGLLAATGEDPVAAIAIGNGTASRETESFVKETLANAPRKLSPAPVVVMVNEAGASVYSASELARAELPDMDLTHRGAVSIARRLQDPLSELVKVEPRALGVGQYQHDVDQRLLTERLDATVEDAVNKVGVDLNTASPALLSYVAGIGPALAKKIVAHRQALGRFDSRRQLLDVGGLGRARFEQMAGFLRIRGGHHPLDASAVHPERYPLVARIAKDLGRDLASLVGERLTIDLARYTDAEVGEPTLNDILDELARPGRDPRDEFAPPAFRDDIQAITDLYPDLELEGVVTNVTTFGAFVDLGVHQDGLIHVSRLADRFVRDPHELVRPGDRVRVRVLEVDLDRKRIALARLG